MKLIIALSATMATLASALAFSATDSKESCWQVPTSNFYDHTVPRVLRLSPVRVTPINPRHPTGSPDNNGGSNLEAEFTVTQNEDGVVLKRSNVVVSVDDAENSGKIVVLEGGQKDTGCDSTSVWSVQAELEPWSDATGVVSVALSYSSTGDSCHSTWMTLPPAALTQISCATISQ